MYSFHLKKRLPLTINRYRNLSTTSSRFGQRLNDFLIAGVKYGPAVLVLFSIPTVVIYSIAKLNRMVKECEQQAIQYKQATEQQAIQYKQAAGQQAIQFEQLNEKLTIQYKQSIEKLTIQYEQLHQKYKQANEKLAIQYQQLHQKLEQEIRKLHEENEKLQEENKKLQQEKLLLVEKATSNKKENSAKQVNQNPGIY